MKSKLEWLRKSQRAIRVVSELHRLGYQRARIMPYMYPLAWRLAIGSADCFSPENGAVCPLGADTLILSNGDFCWSDAGQDTARQLAEKFIARHSTLAQRCAGRDWAYAGWLDELMGFLEHGDWLPVMAWENMKDTPEQLLFMPIWDVDNSNIEFEGIYTIPSRDVRRFPLPPKVIRD